jgi:hypothetical protein
MFRCDSRIEELPAVNQQPGEFRNSQFLNFLRTSQ